MQKKLIILFIFSLTIFNLSAQSKVEFSYQLLVPDMIGEACLDEDAFFEWIKKTQEEIEKYITTEKGDKDIMILISLQTDKGAIVEVGARPAISDERRNALVEVVRKYKAPRTKITQYTFIIYAKINKGSKEDIDFSPSIIPPRYKKFEEYKKLSTADKQENIKKWVKDEVLPILAYHQSKVDPKFVGVLNMGKMLQKLDYTNINVESLTDENPNYWRAMMEMQQGNQLIPFTKACLYISQGKFGRATNLLSIIPYFSEKETLVNILQEALYEKLVLFDEELNASINEGIKLHDKGEYKKAIKHYEELLKDFPYSAWLQYERFFSKMEDKVDTTQTESFTKAWNKAKKVIYACNPMYHMSMKASSGKEGYMLFRRQETMTLFKSKENFESDFIKYADIALDLENYAFAAELYWLITSHIPEKEHNGRNILAHYLYCLDKLGNTETIKIFKDDFEKDFRKIAKERKKIMEKHAMYNSFEKKE